jgi:hypothetical protein
MMAISSSVALKLTALLFAISLASACGTTAQWPDWGQPTPGASRRTCSGQTASNAKPFEFVFLRKFDRCMQSVSVSDASLLVWQDLATTRTEAVNCALAKVGDPTGIYYEVHDSSEVRPFAFLGVDYNTCEFGDLHSDPLCHTTVTNHVSEEAAMACTTLYYDLLFETKRDAQGNIVVGADSGQCRVYDVTAATISLQGQTWVTDYGAMDDLCPKGCFKQ